MDKPTKLRLIADLIENPRPFEVRTSGDWVSPETIPPDSFVEDCWEIRIKPESATFEAHGKTWTRHKPGDPMPCYGEAEVEILLLDNTLGALSKAKDIYWGAEIVKSDQIIGWRYADKPEPAEPTMVPLEAADVPPGSVFQDFKGEGWLAPIAVTKLGVSLISEDNSITDYTWDDLKQGSFATRIKRPGQDWQPCAKPAP